MKSKPDSGTEMLKLAADECYSPETEEAMQKAREVAQAKGLKGLQLCAATRGLSSEAAEIPESDNSMSYPFCSLSFLVNPTTRP
jgi:hypothetical protein